MKRIKAKFKKSDEPSIGLISLVEGLKKVEDSVDRSIEPFTFKLSDKELERLRNYIEREKEILKEYKLPHSSKAIIKTISKKLGIEGLDIEYFVRIIFDKMNIKNSAEYLDKLEEKELIKIVIDVCKRLSIILKQPQQSEKKRNVGFRSASRNNYFAKLKNKLVEKEFICEVGINEFNAIFSGKNVEEIKPLIWNATPTELLYFIRQLISKEVIKGNLNRMDYKPIKHCFRNSKGEVISCSYSSLNNQIKNAEKNNDFSEIMNKEKALIINEIIDSSF